MADTTEGGMFDFMKKKEAKPQDDAVMIDLETTKESEHKEKTTEEKHTLMEELIRTRSDSSSVSLINFLKMQTNQHAIILF